MADHKRSDYLKSLNQMRDAYQNQGNPLINPSNDDGSVGEDLSSFAYMNADVADTTQSASAKDIQADEKNWAQRTWATVMDAGMNVKEGALNWFDSIWDFGNNALKEWGWIDEYTANANKNFDWQSYALSHDAFIFSAVDSVLAGGDKMLSTFANDMTGSTDNIGRNAIDSLHASSYTNEWDWFGDTIVGVEQAVGGMLPSIAIGGDLGGLAASLGGTAKAVGIATKIGTLGSMGLGAFASKTNEEYEKTGNIGTASLSGLASAGVEIGTELLGDAIGLSKIAGVYGNTKLGKSTLGKILSNMAGEGLEEALSGIAEPFVNAISEGTSAFDGLKSNPVDFFFVGTDSVLGQAAIGALTGGVMDAPHTMASAYKYGSSGVNVVEARQNLTETYDKMMEATKKGDSSKAQKLLSEYKSAYSEYIESIKEWGNDSKLTDRQRNALQKDLRSNLNSLIENAKEAQKATEETIKALNEGNFDEIKTPVISSDMLNLSGIASDYLSLKNLALAGNADASGLASYFVNSENGSSDGNPTIEITKESGESIEVRSTKEDGSYANFEINADSGEVNGITEYSEDGKIKNEFKKIEQREQDDKPKRPTPKKDGEYVIFNNASVKQSNSFKNVDMGEIQTLLNKAGSLFPELEMVEFGDEYRQKPRSLSDGDAKGHATITVDGEKYNVGKNFEQLAEAFVDKINGIDTTTVTYDGYEYDLPNKKQVNDVNKMAEQIVDYMKENYTPGSVDGPLTASERDAILGMIKIADEIGGDISSFVYDVENAEYEDAGKDAPDIDYARELDEYLSDVMEYEAEDADNANQSVYDSVEGEEVELEDGTPAKYIRSSGGYSLYMTSAEDGAEYFVMQDEDASKPKKAETAKEEPKQDTKKEQKKDISSMSDDDVSEEALNRYRQYEKEYNDAVEDKYDFIVAKYEYNGDLDLISENKNYTVRGEKYNPHKSFHSFVQAFIDTASYNELVEKKRYGTTAYLPNLNAVNTMERMAKPIYDVLRFYIDVEYGRVETRLDARVYYAAMLTANNIFEVVDNIVNQVNGADYLTFEDKEPSIKYLMKLRDLCRPYYDYKNKDRIVKMYEEMDGSFGENGRRSKYLFKEKSSLKEEFDRKVAEDEFIKENKAREEARKKNESAQSEETKTQETIDETKTEEPKPTAESAKETASDARSEEVNENTQQSEETSPQEAETAQETEKTKESDGENGGGGSEQGKKPLHSQATYDAPVQLILDATDYKNLSKFSFSSLNKGFRELITEVLTDKIGSGYRVEIGRGAIKKAFTDANLTPRTAKAIPSSTIDAIADELLGDRIDVYKGKKGDSDYYHDSGTIRDLMTDEEIAIFKNALSELFEDKGKSTFRNKALNKICDLFASLEYHKAKGRENMRSFIEMNRLKRKIAMGSKLYGSSPTSATKELSVYESILPKIRQGDYEYVAYMPFRAGTAMDFIDRVRGNYTETGIGKILEANNMTLNPAIIRNVDLLSAGGEYEIIPGKPLSDVQLRIINDTLRMFWNEMDAIDGETRQRKINEAKPNIEIAKAVTGVAKDANGVVSSKKGAIVSAIETAKNVTVSPISIAETTVGKDNVLSKHFRDIKDSENNSKRLKGERWGKIRELMAKSGFGSEKASKNGNVTYKVNKKAFREANKAKVSLRGHSITAGQAVSIIMYSETLSEASKKTGKTNFEESGVTINEGGRSVEIRDITKDEIEALKSSLPNGLYELAESIKDELFGKMMSNAINDHYKLMTGTDIPLIDASKGGYWGVSRILKTGATRAGGGSRYDFLTWDISNLVKRTGSTESLNGTIDFMDFAGNYIEQMSNWEAYSLWLQKYNDIINTKVYGETLNSVLQKSVPNVTLKGRNFGWDLINQFVIESVMGKTLPYKDGFLTKLLGKSAQAMMLAPFTQIKTLASLPSLMMYFDAKDFRRAPGNRFSLSESKEIIESYSPSLEARFKSSESISAAISQNASSEMNYYLGTGVRMLDMWIHVGPAFSLAYNKAYREMASKGETWTDEQLKKRAVRILEFASDTTQPTSSKLRVGMYRYGYLGPMAKYAFGMFQSMAQNTTQGLIDAFAEPLYRASRINGLEASIANHDARIAKYSADEANARSRYAQAVADQNNADALSSLNDMRNAQSHIKEHESSKKALSDYLSKEKSRTGKVNVTSKMANFVLATVGSSAMIVLFNNIRKFFYGKKEKEEILTPDMIGDIAYQSTLAWIPFVGTFANAFRNNVDMTYIGMSEISEIVSYASDIKSAIESGNYDKMGGILVKLVEKAGLLAGLPTESYIKLFNGIWYNIDKGSNIMFRNWLGMYSSSYMSTNYSDAISKGMTSKAYANLDVWMQLYGVKSSSATLNEIVRLSKMGYSAKPTSIPSSYKAEDGETYELSTSERNAFQSAYWEANDAIEALISSSAYQSLDDEYKAKAMKKVYDAYYRGAKAKVLGTATETKADKLIALAGDASSAKYIAHLAVLSSAKGKDEVIKYLNSAKGLTKGDKLVISLLKGYSIGDANKTVAITALRRLGMTMKEAKEFVG